ncbi:MAG: DUF262 domain-containing protein [Cyclobacteriaceae bacterium]|nr:DUF262 domain-containing protein [Cyclobacteriaceae bacterium]
MPKQTVPDIDFNKFVIAELPELFKDKKIKINYEYQRGDIWKRRQQIELINSINKRYSIGVIVLFVNDNEQFEILDGQQRILTIKKYLEDKLELSDTDIIPYNELGVQDKALLNAYCVYYLKLKSHDPETKEEDIVQTFLRLQEGTPLNKAEKINAYRGVFKDAFRRTREEHSIFSYFGTEKRFRFRQLAAELLTIELEGDFKNKIFPSLDQETLIKTIKKYEKSVSAKKLKFFIGNLDFLVSSLNYLLTGFKIREVVSFYLLVSYLRHNRAGNEELKNELAEFAKLFLQKLNSFSIYDIKPPKGITRKEFDDYKAYKQEAKVLTTPESIKARLEILISEFDRLHGIIIKDPERLHDTEQKRALFFRQQGLCGQCRKPLDFKNSTSHHIIAHSKGGQTSNLSNAVLLHEKCHSNLEATLRKSKGQGKLF